MKEHDIHLALTDEVLKNGVRVVVDITKDEYLQTVKEYTALKDEQPSMFATFVKMVNRTSSYKEKFVSRCDSVDHPEYTPVLLGLFSSKHESFFYQYHYGYVIKSNISCTTDHTGSVMGVREGLEPGAYQAFFVGHRESLSSIPLYEKYKALIDVK